MTTKIPMIDKLEDMTVELSDALCMKPNFDTTANKLRGYLTDEERNHLGTLRLNLIHLQTNIRVFLENGPEDAS